MFANENVVSARFRPSRASASAFSLFVFFFAKKSLLKKMRYIRSTPFFV